MKRNTAPWVEMMLPPSKIQDMRDYTDYASSSQATGVHD
jgi:hypothetical protein